MAESKSTPRHDNRIARWYLTPWRVVVVMLALMAPLACAKKAYYGVPADPPTENRGQGLSSAQYTELYNKEKSTLMQTVNQEAMAVHRPGATAEEILLACIPEHKLRVNAEGMYEVERGFPETTHHLDLGSTNEWVVSYVSWLNDEFGTFNDLISVVNAVPAERTAKELALTQGMSVLYATRSLLDSLAVAETGGCSFAPVSKHVDLAQGLANELATAQLPTLLRDLEAIGASEMDLMRYRIPLAVLGRQSAAAYCAQIDDRYAGHADEALLLSWCGYDAMRVDDAMNARAFFDRAKLVPGQPELSGYASKQLSSL